jgi:S1-C subfamily serine protease
LVLSVEDDSPAHHAGLRKGDLVISYGGAPVAGVDELQRLLTEQEVGISTIVTIIRGTEKVPLVVVPQESRQTAR